MISDSLDYDLSFLEKIRIAALQFCLFRSLLIQSNPVISNSLISNYRLSQSENLVLVLT